MQTEMMMESLNETLEGLRLDATCVNARQHRHFGFYDVRLGVKCRVSKLQSFSSEIALKLRSKTDPIVRPIPELGIVRLQVVNANPSSLAFEDLLARSSRPKGMLPFLFGETDEGEVLWNDMAFNPHLLVAGGTGSGKSVFLHNLVANAARTPRTRLYLVDPKGVEFAPYRGEQMKSLVWKITQNYDDTIYMLQDLVEEMDNRYEVLLDHGLSSIEESPTLFDKILVIIDEVADLMLLDGKRKMFETLIVKLSQKSRAAGIYFTLATQRPSVNVLTGLIKANFEARLACRVSQRVDSQVVLDHPGAENLIGRGDAILKTRFHDSVRLQVAFVRPQDTVKFYQANNPNL